MVIGDTFSGRYRWTEVGSTYVRGDSIGQTDSGDQRTGWRSEWSQIHKYMMEEGSFDPSLPLNQDDR